MKCFLYRIDGEPGFNAQSFDFLKEKINNEGKEILMSLVLDEMSLHQHLQFDGNQFVGGTGTYLFFYNKLLKRADSTKVHKIYLTVNLPLHLLRG